MTKIHGARLMAGYTKLFSTIVHSTVWREDMHVKVVWITMLALANRNGVVEASVPGLADASRVPLELCEQALEKLSSPDKYSRTPEHGGRRISKTEGGWQVLNYLKYRELQSKDEMRIKTRERVAAHREKKRKAVTVTPGNAPLQQAEATTNYQLPTTKNGLAASPSAPLAKRKAWSIEACDDWISRYGGTAPGGRIGKAIEPLVKAHGWDSVRPVWQRYLTEKDAEFANPQEFAGKFGLWSGDRPMDGKRPLTEDPSVQAFLKGAARDPRRV
jgi:hypothetical protein